MIDTNSKYEDVIREFAEKINNYINGKESNFVDCLKYDIPYIKQMITMISAIFEKEYREVDNDIAELLDFLEKNNS